MNPEVVVPLAGIIMIISIVLVPVWLKSRERREMQATLRASIERGQTLPPDVIDALSRENIKPAPTAARDLRVGVILLAVAIGIGTTFGYMGYYFGDDARDFMGFGAWAAIPGAVGLAFIVLSFFNKNKG